MFELNASVPSKVDVYDVWQVCGGGVVFAIEAGRVAVPVRVAGYPHVIILFGVWWGDFFCFIREQLLMAARSDVWSIVHLTTRP
jgi:hypothetical protein